MSTSTADDSYHGPRDGLVVATIILTVLVAVGAGVYMSGAADDMMEWVGKKYFKYEAKAEEKALEKAGSDEAQGFLKDRLKKNPMVGNDELNQISGGLGDEASKEFGGLGKKFE